MPPGSRDDGARARIQVRVVSYNVRSLRDDASAVAANLRSLAPDLACLQEAPRFLFAPSKCRQLAEAAGLSVLTGGRVANGNLLLGGPRATLGTASRLRLPRSGRRHRRPLALATVVVDGVRVTLGGTHLSLDPLERLRQVRRVVSRLGVVGAEPGPHTVLGADVNDGPGSQAWQALTGLLLDAYVAEPCGGELTFPARDPQRRIDAIFVSADVTVLGCGVPAGLVDPASATDHLPVVADLVVQAN